MTLRTHEGPSMSNEKAGAIITDATLLERRRIAVARGVATATPA
jgi:hypothetical protein